MTDLKETLLSSVERGEMTIPQFMEKKRMEGGVDLDLSTCFPVASAA